MKLLLWLLPLVHSLKHRPEGEVYPLQLALGKASAPSRDLPQRFQKLDLERLYGRPLEYLRCDPKVPPQADGERCAPFKGELHFTPRPLKLVLGVMAMTSQEEIQDAHRATWMKKPGVCPVQQYQDVRCRVFPVFVFGSTNRTLANDSVRLESVPEPPAKWDGFKDSKGTEGWKRSWWTSQFKTPAWLAYAAANFPWATHVGKMDSDTFPDIISVMEDLARKPVSVLGHEWPVLYGRHFMGGYNGKGGVFGEFYALSSSLLECFLKEDAKKVARSGLIHGHKTTWGSEWWKYAEDQVLRTTLFYAEENRVCPAILDAKAFTTGSL